MLHGMRAEELLDALLELTPAIRYAAINPGKGEPVFRQRLGIADPSSADSDYWEELLVNPVLLELTRRRGDVDCGGLEYVIVRYGHFAQLVLPLEQGHVSVCFEPITDPVPLVPALRQACEAHGARTVVR
jgi:hypothetical protein